MLPDAGELYEVRDSQRHPIGRLTVEAREGELLRGSFVPAEGYPNVAGLFRAFEEAAEQQALRVVEQIDQQIATLGLRLSRDDESKPIDIRDVQIWSDGGMSCRLTDPAASVTGDLSASNSG